MHTERTFASAKSKFFSNDFAHPFSKQEWRGCVLDRDLLPGTRIPRALWSAIIESAHSDEVFVCAHLAGRFSCRSISTRWSDLQDFMSSNSNYSSEYLFFDDSNQWAVLADEDVTTFAADQVIANQVDSKLLESGSSLLALTLNSFPKEDLLKPGGTYVRNVLGPSYTRLEEKEEEKVQTPTKK